MAAEQGLPCPDTARRMAARGATTLAVSLTGAPAQPAASLAHHLKTALQLRQTPLVIDRRGEAPVAWVTDGLDQSALQRTESVTLFGVLVGLRLQQPMPAVAAQGPAPQAAPTEYAAVMAEYGAMAQRTASFNSMNSSPAEWGYTPAFLARALGSSTTSGSTGDQEAAQLLAVACGGGCPLSRVPPEAPLDGATVVDLGCGGGHDVAFATHLVGPAGRVVGIDLTPQMIVRAEAVVEKFGRSDTQCELICAPIDSEEGGGRPEASRHSADIVISNGVVNLCADKQGAFDTAAFWCKPGGMFVYSDVVREPPPPAPPSATALATAAVVAADGEGGAGGDGGWSSEDDGWIPRCETASAHFVRPQTIVCQDRLGTQTERMLKQFKFKRTASASHSEWHQIDCEEHARAANGDQAITLRS
jgi:SAM-dependent methyltransferase